MSYSRLLIQEVAPSRSVIPVVWLSPVANPQLYNAGSISSIGHSQLPFPSRDFFLLLVPRFLSSFFSYSVHYPNTGFFWYLVQTIFSQPTSVLLGILLTLTSMYFHNWLLITISLLPPYSSQYHPLPGEQQAPNQALSYSCSNKTSSQPTIQRADVKSVRSPHACAQKLPLVSCFCQRRSQFVV